VAKDLSWITPFLSWREVLRFPPFLSRLPVLGCRAPIPQVPPFFFPDCRFFALAHRISGMLLLGNVPSLSGMMTIVHVDFFLRYSSTHNPIFGLVTAFLRILSMGKGSFFSPLWGFSCAFFFCSHASSFLTGVSGPACTSIAVFHTQNVPHLPPES